MNLRGILFCVLFHPFIAFGMDHVHLSTQWVQGHLMIKVWVNDSIPATFIFDTGATATVIDSAFAEKHELKANYQQQGAGAGGVEMFQIILNQKIRLHDEVLLDGEHLVIKNLQTLQAIKGHSFNGIIGYSVLKKYVTRLDFLQPAIHLISPSAFQAPEDFDSMDFSFINNVPIPALEVAVRPLKGDIFMDLCLFDTGAGLTLLMNTPFKEQENIPARMEKTVRSTSINFNKSSIYDEGRVHSFVIGRFNLLKPTVQMSSDTSGVSSWKGLMGILGSEVIRRFDWYLDYANKKLYLKPNDQFSDPFPIPTGGIKVGLEGTKIVIKGIVEPSPAFTAGLRPGMELVSINDKIYTELELCREILKMPAKKLKITVRDENGKLKKFNLAYPELL